MFLCSILGENWYRHTGRGNILLVVSIVDRIHRRLQVHDYMPQLFQLFKDTHHTFICGSSQILCDEHAELYKKMSLSCQWGIWQHELYQQIHSSNMSRPSHLCICQYIQHPLPLLVECSIRSSRCGHV